MKVPLTVLCPICGRDMNWLEGYGRPARCCGRDCYDEFEWRYALAIVGKSYRPKQNTEELK